MPGKKKLLVIGGGTGGAILAVDAAKKGMDVTLVDRDGFAAQGLTAGGRVGLQLTAWACHSRCKRRVKRFTALNSTARVCPKVYELPTCGGSCQRAVSHWLWRGLRGALSACVAPVVNVTLQRRPGFKALATTRLFRASTFADQAPPLDPGCVKAIAGTKWPGCLGFRPDLIF
eukprot:359328-Chlamydomonas_euryale.AAC.12